MSKLRDRIRRAFERRPAPLGFAARRPEQDSHRFVLVMAEVADAAAATTAVGAGVDAVLYSNGVQSVAAIVEAAGELPVGARLEAATGDSTDALIDAAVDFLVFDDVQTEAAALLRDELGHVARIADLDASDDDLRLLQPLELDAILIPGRDGTLSVREQLLTRRIGELARKPLIVPVGAGVTSTALQVWRDAGAPVVLAPGADAAALERLVATASEVPPPRERREDRPDPLVPSAGHTPDLDDDEEED